MTGIEPSTSGIESNRSANWDSISGIKMFFKLGQPWPLFHLFSTFQTHIKIFTTNKCEKCPSSIQSRDSNLRPLEHESPPITTRPELLPKTVFTWQKYRRDREVIDERLDGEDVRQLVFGGQKPRSFHKGLIFCYIARYELAYELLSNQRSFNCVGSLDQE